MVCSTLTKATKDAITSTDPRGRLIDLYVAHLAGSSLQSWSDLCRVRDALGLPAAGVGVDLSDGRLEGLKDFFHARNEIAHELDLVDPSGRGSRSGRHRDMTVVGTQCSDVLTIIEAFLRATATTVKNAGATAADQPA